MSEELISIYQDFLKYVERIYGNYVEQIKRLNDMWNEYKNAVLNVKKSWDVDGVMLLLRLSELKASIESLREEIDVLKVKRELDLISDEEYSKLTGELTEALSKLTSMFEDVKAKIEEIDRNIKEHWLRSMDVTSLTPEQVDSMIRELEEGRARGEIPDELYERLKADLELMRRIVQALSLIKSRG